MNEQNNVIVGIYKITSPKGKIYIGQSININDRWYVGYEKMNCKGQPKLYNSLQKYGWKNHIFEIIEKCNLKQLNKRETFWKKYYLNEFGWKMMLFCELYDKGGGPKSEETKRKIGNSNKGKVGWIKGKSRSEEDKQKMRKPKNHGFNVSIGFANMNKNSKILRSIKLSKKLLGKSKPEGFNLHLCKPIIQYNKENILIKEWNSAKEASIHTKISDSSINQNLKKRNKTAGGFIWEYK